MKKKSKVDWGLFGMAMLGGTAISALAYALEGTSMPKLADAGIEAGAGLAIGAATSMVSKGLGAGIAAGGMAMGAKNAWEDLSLRLAKPATETTEKAGDVSAIRTRRANLNAVRGAAAPRQLNPANTISMENNRRAGMMNAIRVGRAS